MDWSCSLIQAGRPYKDRLFPLGQFHHAIAPCRHTRQRGSYDQVKQTIGCPVVRFRHREPYLKPVEIYPNVPVWLFLRYSL